MSTSPTLIRPGLAPLPGVELAGTLLAGLAGTVAYGVIVGSPWPTLKSGVVSFLSAIALGTILIAVWSWRNNAHSLRVVGGQLQAFSAAGVPLSPVPIA